MNPSTIRPMTPNSMEKVVVSSGVAFLTKRRVPTMFAAQAILPARMIASPVATFSPS
ncbi:hypothetical protein D3C75_1290000 [compost metagenome]